MTFNFSGDDRITVYTPYWQYITVLVGDYVRSSANYVGWNFDAQAGYGGGYPLTSGTGYRYDRQNFPTENTLPFTSGYLLGSEVDWQLGYWSVGNTYDSADLTQIIQEAINDPGYAADGNELGVRWDPQNPLPGDMFYVANYEHATYDPPELIVIYKPRRVYTVT